MRLQLGFSTCAVFLLVCAACAPIGNSDADKKPLPSFLVATKKQSQSKQHNELPAALQKRIEAVLDNIKNRELRTSHSFWTVIHAILANGLDAELHDIKTNELVKAIDYICHHSERIRGLQFLVQDPLGVDVRVGPMFDGQGHLDQFIGELAQCRMPVDYEFRINGKKYVFEDFLRYAKTRASVTKGGEYSWTLVALSQYYGPDSSWTNMHGEKIAFEDLVRYELNQPIETKAACGGTHRLFGLTWAYYLHRKNGGDTKGVWADVAAAIAKYQKRAKEFQNADGSFSTGYFHERGNIPDLDKRIGCTGHIMEWLALSLPEEELKAPWMQNAAHALVRLILDGAHQSLDAGSLYHAAHGLRIYYDRVYDKKHISKLPPVPVD